MEASTRRRILVRDVMNSPLVTARPEDTVKEVAKKMVEAKVGSVVVLQGKRPVGLVTDGDIVSKAVAKNIPSSKMLAKDIMSRPLHTVDSDVEIPEAARLMRRFKVKRLGVTYKKRIVGMVSVSDLLSATPELMDLASEKARVLSGESRRQYGYLAGYCDFCNQWSDYLLEYEGRFVCEDCRKEEI